MFVDTINQVSVNGIRQLSNYNVRLHAKKYELYVRTPSKVQLLKSVTIRVEVVLESDDGRICPVLLKQRLPPEWEPGRTSRLSLTQLMQFDVAMNWLACTNVGEISRQLNRLGQVSMRGIRTRRAYDDQEEVTFEVIAPIYIGNATVDLNAKPRKPTQLALLKEFVQVR